MRFRAYDLNGGPGLAVLTGGAWRDLGARLLIDVIREGRAADPSLADGAPQVDVAALALLPPIPRPGKIICVGLNYVDHAAESPYKDVPKYPAFFVRFATSLIADGAPILRPECSHELDFEGELVAVIGNTARHVTEAEALSHVAGYSIFNDGSVRNYQFLAPQWTPGKNFDNTGAFGPEFITADELPPGAKGLQLEVFLNGQKMQSANTDDMVFPVAALVSIASEFTTLEPGDVIVTGTPAGVGFARKPQVFMKDGDRVEVVIEGLGRLSNPVRNETRAVKAAE